MGSSGAPIRLLSALVLLAGGLAGCASTAPGRALDPCRAVLDQGIIPPIPEELKTDLLCRSWLHGASGMVAAGFGFGSTVRGQTLSKENVWPDTTRWRQEHCGGWPPDSRPPFIPRDRLLSLSEEERSRNRQAWREWMRAQILIFAEARSQAPARQLNNWRSCRAYVEDLDEPWVSANLACAALLSEDERTVTLLAQYTSDDWLGKGYRLRKPARTRGIRCAETWETGTYFRPFKLQQLQCQRIEGENVYLRIESGRFACEASIPWTESLPPAARIAPALQGKLTKAHSFRGQGDLRKLP